MSMETGSTKTIGLWPDLPALAVLCSGGIDSAVLLAEALRRYPAVYPIYIQVGSSWEDVEVEHLGRFLRALPNASLRPLVVLKQPVADLYGTHWSLTGENVPDENSPDEAVFLPGRNVLLLAKSLLWCHLNRVPAVALAPLAGNPFPDATPEFFDGFAASVNRAVAGLVSVLRPYLSLDKSQVLRRATDLPLEYTFSCIRPVNRKHCGRCNKCSERQRAFRAAEIKDPTNYANVH